MLSFPFFAASQRLGRRQCRHIPQSSSAVLVTFRPRATSRTPRVSFSFPSFSPSIRHGTHPLLALSPSVCSTIRCSSVPNESTHEPSLKEGRTTHTVRRRRSGAPLFPLFLSPLSRTFSFWSSAVRRAVMTHGGAGTVPLTLQVAWRQASSQLPYEKTTTPDGPHHECHTSDASVTKRMPHAMEGGSSTHREEKKKGVEEKEKEETLLRMWRDTSPHPSVFPPPHATTSGASSPKEEESRNTTPPPNDLGNHPKKETSSSSSLSSRSSTAPSSPLPPSTGAPPAAGQTFQDSRPCDPNETTEVKRRRLLYQSQYRGMVEMDLIFGHFARCKLSQLPMAMLMEYDVLLKQLDNDLFKWLVMEEEAPEAIASLKCFEVLKTFVNEEKKELLECY